MTKRIFSTRGAALAVAASLAIAGPQALADSASTQGGITVKSEDGRFVGTFGGRLMADFAAFDNDTAENVSGAEFRRIRFHAKGKIYDAKYVIDVDFGDNEIDLKDAYLQFDLLGGALTVGQFKQYFSLEELTSSRHLTMLERSFVTAFGPVHQFGVGYWTKLGIFGGGISAYNTDDNGDGADVDGDGQADENNEGFGASLRLVAGPKFGNAVQTHFGISAVSEGGVQGRNRVRIRPAGHLSDASRTTLVDINNGQRSESTLMGIEAAVVAGPVSLQTELVDGTFEDDTQEEDIKAWYVQASFFITGESRPYKLGSGKFGRVKPKRSSGAWELTARVDYAENDTLEREIEAQTVGVNWYLNPQTRFMLNYIQADVLEGADEPNAVTGRIQFDF